MRQVVFDQVCMALPHKPRRRALGQREHMLSSILFLLVESAEWHADSIHEKAHKLTSERPSDFPSLGAMSRETHKIPRLIQK